MSDTTIVDATTTTHDSGAEPQTVRRRTVTVRSKLVNTLTFGVLIDLDAALAAAGAPLNTTVRTDKDSNGWFRLVAEWSQDVEVVQAP